MCITRHSYRPPTHTQIDMFAFGMMLYELFAKRLITFDMIKKGIWQDSAKFIHIAAHQVADGFRPEFPAYFPAEIRPLVEACWSEVCLGLEGVGLLKCVV